MDLRRLERQDTEKLIDILDKMVLNESIKNEILKRIENIFKTLGTVMVDNAVDGFSLYAKDSRNKDFLELKYINDCFYYNYTSYNYNKFINITSRKLKNKNIKFERKEKVEYATDDKLYSTEIEEIEEIYNSNKKLVYESKLNKDISNNTYGNYIQYSKNDAFTNYFELNKKWHLHNGSIIKYDLKKSFLHRLSKIEENYSICPEICSDGYANHQNFVDLNEELFKQFMSGEIIIDELLKKINNKKILKKRTDNI